MPDKYTHVSSSQCLRHRAVKSTPQNTSYVWYDVTCPSVDLKGHNLLVPPNRCKHAACLHDDKIYVYGGRNGGTCHGNMWRCSLADMTWTEVKCQGDTPQSPQEHTMLAYKNHLYLFGGQFWCSYDNEVPLWILDLETLTWRRKCSQSEVLTPGGRRGHTAVIDHGVMYIYGGYVDLKGSSNELWMFDLETEMWHLSPKLANNEPVVDGRHGHSAVVYDGAMFVYGGMSNLVAKDDFWRYVFVSGHWTRIRSRPNPPALKGHTACVIADQMLVFGGTSQGSAVNSLWCFHFGSNSWCRLSTQGVSPPACLQHAVVVVLHTDINIHTSQECSSSHSLLQTNKQSTICLETRPRSSPASLTTHRVSNAELSTFLIKNKIVPSYSPPSCNRSITLLRNSPECCLQEKVAINNHTHGQISPENSLLLSEKSQVLSKSAASHFAEGITNNNVCSSNANLDTNQTFVEEIAVSSVCHSTTSSSIVTTDNSHSVKVTGKHKYEQLLDSQENSCFDNTSRINSTLSRKGLGREDVDKPRCYSDRESHLVTKSVIMADDLKLEDIEDDDTLDSAYLGGATSQYVVDDFLASSSDILNLSNSSETTRLVSNRASHVTTSQNSKKAHGRLQCLSPSDKTRSAESLSYGMTNPLFAIYDVSHSTSANEHRKSCGDFTQQTSQTGPGQRSCNDFSYHHHSDKNDKQSSADVHSVSPQNSDVLTAVSTLFFNPCYFNDCDHKNSEIIEMSDFAVQLGIKADGSWSACQTWNRKECNSENTTSNTSYQLKRDTTKKKSTKSVTTTQVLTPALSLPEEQRMYYMYIVGGQMAESKRFGFNPINLWQLTMTLDKKY